MNINFLFLQFQLFFEISIKLFTGFNRQIGSNKMWILWKSNHTMKPLGLVQSIFFRIDFRGMYPRGNYLILSLIMESEYKLLLYEPFEVTFRINSTKNEYK